MRKHVGEECLLCLWSIAQRNHGFIWDVCMYAVSLVRVIVIKFPKKFLAVLPRATSFSLSQGMALPLNSWKRLEIWTQFLYGCHLLHHGKNVSVSCALRHWLSSSSCAWPWGAGLVVWKSSITRGSRWLQLVKRLGIWGLMFCSLLFSVLLLITSNVFKESKSVIKFTISPDIAAFLCSPWRLLFLHKQPGCVEARWQPLADGMRVSAPGLPGDLILCCSSGLSYREAGLVFLREKSLR